MGFSAGGSKNNFNYWNSVEINQYYMNERGVDSVPTNFSRKEVATSQERPQMMFSPALPLQRALTVVMATTE